MDKLVKYIETRRKKYGHIKGEQAVFSMYYTIGDKVVRVSDHLKYGETSVKKFDYNFVIQPNELYIFSQSPKYTQQAKMFLKIMTLPEVKKLIRRLHDFAISMDDACEVYSPEGWNKNDGTQYEKPSWEEFFNKYMDGLDDLSKLNVCDKIEHIFYGSTMKGKLTEKLDRVPELYESFSLTQYDTLLKKLDKIVNF